MAWCNNCGEAMQSPSIRQVLTEDYRCDICGASNAEQLSEENTKEAMIDLLNRIEALEAAYKGKK